MTTLLGPSGRKDDLLAGARRAVRSRAAWSAFSERPDRLPGAEDAIRAAQESFAGTLGTRFALDQPSSGVRLSDEVSPYTGQALGISYPVSSAEDLFKHARGALAVWRDVPWERRVELCEQVVERLSDRLFEIAVANTHTTGQSFSMSCVGGGTNALDRGLEALAYAAEAMGRAPTAASWSKDFGRDTVTLDKRFRIMPRGVAVVITCASFPTWNAYPALLANLATGNPVILKPHPTSVLTMALTVRACQEVLAGAGLPTTIVQLAMDTQAEPLAQDLVTHPDCAIVDFTGSPEFGTWIEQHAHPAITFTETAGVNTVVLDSVADLDAVAEAIATSLCLFTAQMCTSAQNVYLPAAGVRTPDGVASVAEVEQAIVRAVQAITDNPRRAAGVLGAVQSPHTVARVREVVAAAARLGRVLLEPGTYPHPEHPDAWTCTPAVVAVGTDARELYGREQFGPVSFVVTCADAGDALQQAVSDVRRAGAIASHLYSTDSEVLERGTQAYWDAGASLTCNLTGAMPLNFAAAYSDFHVTGLSPAGNACLTDEAFIAGRFRVLQERRPATST